MCIDYIHIGRIHAYSQKVIFVNFSILLSICALTMVCKIAPPSCVSSLPGQQTWKWIYSFPIIRRFLVDTLETDHNNSRYRMMRDRQVPCQHIRRRAGGYGKQLYGWNGVVPYCVSSSGNTRVWLFVTLNQCNSGDPTRLFQFPDVTNRHKWN